MKNSHELQNARMLMQKEYNKFIDKKYRINGDSAIYILNSFHLSPIENKVYVGMHRELAFDICRVETVDYFLAAFELVPE